MPRMPSGPIDGLTTVGDDRAAVLGVLRNHRGRDHAIRSREIARALQMDTRQVREMIADLVQDGVLIGASVHGKNGGYYLIVDAADLEETRAILRSRAARIFERDRALCLAWEREHGRPVQPLLPALEEV